MDADALWERLRPDAQGLVPAIVVHHLDGRVLMLGYMNRESFAATLTRRRVTFWSRSRQQLWEKGETSGHTLELEGLRFDCDQDALLVEANPRGPTCHTGQPSCFFHAVDLDSLAVREDAGPEREAFAQLYQVIEDRKAGRGITQAEGKSYVRHLLDRGTDKINEKIAEEGAELCRALRSESDERVAEEAADLFFHAFVGLANREVALEAVAEVLRARHGRSGIDEKAARSRR
jgi:phosphoribosyl-ATP pyrophosphohydrolase/phosphoribosyl-AMP cyclohydrolase